MRADRPKAIDQHAFRLEDKAEERSLLRSGRGLVVKMN